MNAHRYSQAGAWEQGKIEEKENNHLIYYLDECIQNRN